MVYNFHIPNIISEGITPNGHLNELLLHVELPLKFLPLLYWNNSFLQTKEQKQTEMTYQQ